MRSMDAGAVFVRVHARPPAGNGGTPAEVEQKIRAEEVQNIPRGLRVSLLDPGVRVRLEKKLTRSVAVKAQLVDKPAPDYEVVRIVVTPPKVRVSGPRSFVAALDEVRTEPISIEGLDASRVFRGRHLVLPDAPGSERVVIEPPTVDVRVEIDQVRQEMEFEVPVAPTSTGWSVEPGQVTVKLKITPDLADRIADGLRAVVDTDDLPADGKVRRLPVRLPIEGLDPFSRSRVEVLAIDPPRVRVRRQRHP